MLITPEGGETTLIFHRKTSQKCLLPLPAQAQLSSLAIKSQEVRILLMATLTILTITVITEHHVRCSIYMYEI